jgi:hypothetical protein
MNPKPYPEADSIPREKLKVSEPVAGYVISPPAATATMAAKSRRIAGLEASDEVWDFAQKHRLAPHLETAVRLVKESFHDIRTLYFTFDPDPEEPSLDGIIIHIKVGGAMEEWNNQYKAYALRFIDKIPNDVRGKICLFYY